MKDLAREGGQPGAHLFLASHAERLDLFQGSVILDVTIRGGEFLWDIVCLFRELPNGREELIMGHGRELMGSMSSTLFKLRVPDKIFRSRTAPVFRDRP